MICKQRRKVGVYRGTEIRRGNGLKIEMEREKNKTVRRISKRVSSDKLLIPTIFMSEYFVTLAKHSISMEEGNTRRSDPVYMEADGGAHLALLSR